MSMLTPRGVGAGRPRRSRAGRRVLLLVLAAALVAAVAWGVWAYVLAPADGGATPRAVVSCPPPASTPTTVPATQVRVNVYNATDRRGLAARVATELRKRGFRVGKVDNDPAKRTVTGAAEVRHSTVGGDAARTVAAQVGAVVAVPDQRTDASVDLVLGAAFTRLRPPDAAAAALSPTPKPRPSGC